MAVEPLLPQEPAPPPTNVAYDGFAYFQGAIVPFGEAKVSVGTHALNYGTACFEGIRGYCSSWPSTTSAFSSRRRCSRSSWRSPSSNSAS